jgi:hypothetical protein
MVTDSMSSRGGRGGAGGANRFKRLNLFLDGQLAWLSGADSVKVPICTIAVFGSVRQRQDGARLLRGSLRHGRLGAVVAKLARLPMTASQ